MISVFASQLSSCLSLNRFVTVNESVTKIWKRLNAKSYSKALLRNQKIDPTPVFLSKEIKEKLFKIDAVNGVEMSKKIQETLGVEVVPNKMIDEIKSLIQTEHGTKNEKKSIDMFEKKLDETIGERNERLFTKVIIPNELNLCGRIDGMTENGTLIEMKNRVYRFFDDIPIYEQVQLQAYMHLTEKSEVKYIQTFKGESRSEIVPFDPSFWESIVSKLVDFNHRFKLLLEDEAYQDAIVLDTMNFYDYIIEEEEEEDEEENDSDSEQRDLRLSCEGCINQWSSQRDHACLGYGI